MNEKKKCNRCKVERPVKYFSLKRSEEYFKSCDECKEKQKIAKNKNKCKHGRQRTQCKECDGANICEHEKYRSSCKECGDPIKITITKWISNSKKADIKYNRYEEKEFIDQTLCEELVSFYKHCYHCSVPIQYITYQDDLASIERLDNSIGHIKSNCVIACLKCNRKRVSNNKNKEELA